MHDALKNKLKYFQGQFLHFQWEREKNLFPNPYLIHYSKIQIVTNLTFQNVVKLLIPNWNKKEDFFLNPSYGRHKVSWPMRIEALIPNTSFGGRHTGKHTKGGITCSAMDSATLNSPMFRVLCAEISSGWRPKRLIPPSREKG